MTDCGCGETRPEDLCEDPDSGLSIAGNKICDERFIGMDTLSENITLIGVTCSPAGRCLKKFTAPEGSDCGGFVVLDSSGCASVTGSPTFSGYEEDNAITALDKISHIWVGKEVGECLQLIGLTSLAAAGNPVQVMWFDPDEGYWISGSFNFLLNQLTAPLQSASPLAFLGWDSIPDETWDLGTQQPQAPTVSWFYHPPGIIIQNSNRFAESFPYTAGVLWNDGTDPYWAGLAGNAGKWLRVNSAGTAVEWAAQGDQWGYIIADEYVGVPTGWTADGSVSNGELVAPDKDFAGTMVEGARYKFSYFCEAMSPHFRIYPYKVSGPNTEGAGTFEYEIKMQPPNSDNSTGDYGFLYGVAVSKKVSSTSAFVWRLAFNDSGFSGTSCTCAGVNTAYLGGGTPVKWGMLIERVA